MGKKIKKKSEKKKLESEKIRKKKKFDVEIQFKKENLLSLLKFPFSASKYNPPPSSFPHSSLSSLFHFLSPPLHPFLSISRFSIFLHFLSPPPHPSYSKLNQSILYHFLSPPLFPFSLSLSCHSHFPLSPPRSPFSISSKPCSRPSSPFQFSPSPSYSHSSLISHQPFPPQPFFSQTPPHYSSSSNSIPFRGSFSSFSSRPPVSPTHTVSLSTIPRLTMPTKPAFYRQPILCLTKKRSSHNLHPNIFD